MTIGLDTAVVEMMEELPTDVMLWKPRMEAGEASIQLISRTMTDVYARRNELAPLFARHSIPVSFENDPEKQSVQYSGESSAHGKFSLVIRNEEAAGQTSNYVSLVANRAHGYGEMKELVHVVQHFLDTPV